MAAPEVFGKIAQSVMALGLSTIPLWGKTLFADDLKYVYLLEPPYVYQVIAVSLILVFSPQILAGVHVVWRGAVSGAFFAAYRFKKGHVAPLIMASAVTLCLVVGMVTLAIGGWRYAYSAIREVKYYEGVYRGRLVALANEQNMGPLIADGIETVDRVLSLYPTEDRNGPMINWSHRVHSAQKLSETLRLRAVSLSDAGQYLRSTAFVQASLEVWPENALSKSMLEAFESELRSASPALERLFDRCATSRSPLGTDQSVWKFLVAAPASSAEMANLTREEQERLAAQLCSQTLRQPNMQEFLAAIRSEALGLRKDAE